MTFITTFLGPTLCDFAICLRGEGGLPLRRVDIPGDRRRGGQETLSSFGVRWVERTQESREVFGSRSTRGRHETLSLLYLVREPVGVLFRFETYVQS